MLSPSCPAHEMVSVVRTPPTVQTNPALGKLTPSIEPYFADNSICINMIKGCYCARKASGNLFPCAKDMGQ